MFQFYLFIDICPQASAAIARRVISNTTLAFSNVVGPLEEISFYGHQVAYIAPSVYGSPHVSSPKLH